MAPILFIFRRKSFYKQDLIFFLAPGIFGISFLWGISSVGRALDLHSKGQEFDPPILHQNFFFHPFRMNFPLQSGSQ